MQDQERGPRFPNQDEPSEEKEKYEDASIRPAMRALSRVRRNGVPAVFNQQRRIRQRG